jgi:hypothetical protein
MDKTSVNVELVIEGDDFDLEAVSARLGLTPTKQRRRGDIIKRKAIDSEEIFVDTSVILRWKKNTWGVETGYSETYYISDQAQKLLNIVGGKTDELRQIQDECNVEILISFIVDVRDDIAPALVFERELIAFAHASKARIEIDMF